MKIGSVVVIVVFLVFGLFAFIISQADIDSAKVRFESKQFGMAELDIKKK